MAGRVEAQVEKITMPVFCNDYFLGAGGGEEMCFVAYFGHMERGVLV